MSFLGWVFLSASVDKNITVAFVPLSPEGKEVFTLEGSETVSLCFYQGQSGPGDGGVRRLSAQPGGPFVEGDRPHKE